MNTLTEIAEELGKDLERLQYAGKTVTVKYKVCAQSRELKEADSKQLHTFESERFTPVLQMEAE